MNNNLEDLDLLVGDYANSEIANIWLNNFSVKKLPKFYTGTHQFELKEFKKIIKDKILIKELIEEVINGKIIFIKKALSKNSVEALKTESINFWNSNEDCFCKMYQNCKNFHRIIDHEVSKNYSIKAIKHSTYIFPWNEDFTGVRNEIMEIWRSIKVFEGLNSYAYEANTPKDKIVDRIQICLYPPKIGYLEAHTDPTHNQMLFISGYLSKRGDPTAYLEGGFYVMDEFGNKIDLEDQIEEGDFAIGMASIQHGVNLIDPDFTGPNNWYSKKGRWFLGLYSNDSDEVKDRRTSRPS